MADDAFRVRGTVGGVAEGDVARSLADDIRSMIPFRWPTFACKVEGKTKQSKKG